MAIDFFSCYVYEYFVIKAYFLFLNALILTKYVKKEEVDRHFNLSSEVLNDDITKRYHVDDYFNVL